MLKIIFLGNHTVGVTVLKELIKISEVVGIVAHPEDPEDGTVYESVFEFAKQNNIPTIRSNGKDGILKEFILEKKPDLLYIVDFRYLLKKEIINLAPLGALNMHPSKLPKFRGRASINWAILKGENQIGLSVHFVDEGADTGDIIAQTHIDLNDHQDVGDALELLYPKYSELSRLAINLIESGEYKPIKQDESESTYYPKRRPEDGKIDFQDNPITIKNLIRAVAPPYPGAFGFIGEQKLIIQKAVLIENTLDIPLTNGLLYQVSNTSFHIYLDSSYSLLVTSWKFDGKLTDGMKII
jgi:methionyl-tRNA formyltransferase